MAGKGYVYELINDNDTVVYIGSSNDVKRRIHQHFYRLNNGKMRIDEYKTITSIKYTEFDSINDARMAEIYLIQKYKPRFNTTFKSDDDSSIFNIDESKLVWNRMKVDEFWHEPSNDTYSEIKAKCSKNENKRKSVMKMIYPDKTIRNPSSIQKISCAAYLFQHMDQDIGTEEEWGYAFEEFMKKFSKIAVTDCGELRENLFKMRELNDLYKKNFTEKFLFEHEIDDQAGQIINNLLTCYRCSFPLGNLRDAIGHCIKKHGYATVYDVIDNDVFITSVDKPNDVIKRIQRSLNRYTKEHAQ